jgi:DNA modification methylase
MAHEKAAAEWVDIGDIHAWEDNPRDNAGAVDSVAASIKRFGFGSPIIARKADGEIIAGHTRYLAAQKLGLRTVPVRFMDLDPVESHLLALADNKVGEIAEWDAGGLADVIRELTEGGADFEGIGFSAEELDALLVPVGVEVELVPEAEQEAIGIDSLPPAVSVLGEVYELGPHRLICGDSRDDGTVAKLLDGQKINIGFTSPPYASQRAYDEASGFKPIHPDKFSDWFQDVAANVATHLAGDGSWFVNIKEHAEDGQRSLYVKDLVIAHVREWGWRFVDELCWAHNGLPGHFPDRFKNQFEPIFHFSLARPKFRPQAVSFESEHAFKYEKGRERVTTGNVGFKSAEKSEGLALPGNVIKPDKAKGSNGHSAAFPVALPEFFIKAYTDHGDTVYDPFLGSGTTLIAAAGLGRVAFGCEISPKYCDVIRRRWTAFAKANDLDPGTGALEPVA